MTKERLVQIIQEDSCKGIRCHECYLFNIDNYLCAVEPKRFMAVYLLAHPEEAFDVLL